MFYAIGQIFHCFKWPRNETKSGHTIAIFKKYSRERWKENFGFEVILWKAVSET